MTDGKFNRSGDTRWRVELYKYDLLLGLELESEKAEKRKKKCLRRKESFTSASSRGRGRKGNQLHLPLFPPLRRHNFSFVREIKRAARTRGDSRAYVRRTTSHYMNNFASRLFFSREEPRVPPREKDRMPLQHATVLQHVARMQKCHSFLFTPVSSRLLRKLLTSSILDGRILIPISL